MLFSKIEELRQYVNVTEGLNFETIAPDINRCESQILKRYLGALQYDELNIEYNLRVDDLEEMEGRLFELLQKVRPAVALLSVLNGAGMLSVQISDSGFQMISTETHKQAFAWMKNDAKAYLAQFGYLMIDELLSFMEANKDDYPLWTADERAYGFNKKYMIPTALVFNDFIKIGESQLTYLALQPMMSRVEAFKIAPSISAGLFNQIKEEIKNNNVSDDNSMLLGYLQPAIAYFTAAKALFELPLQITETGVLMNYAKAFSTQQNTESSVADIVDRRKVAEQWENDGASYLNLCINYLNDTASAEKYSTFFKSNLYKGSGGRFTPYTAEATDKIVGFF
jgi:hypothetical protein